MQARLSFPVRAMARGVSSPNGGWVVPKRMAAGGALPDSMRPEPMGRVRLDCFGVIADFVIVQAARRRRPAPSQRWELRTKKGHPGLLSPASPPGGSQRAGATLEYLYLILAPSLAIVTFKPSGTLAAETPRDAVFRRQRSHICLPTLAGQDTPADYPPPWVWSFSCCSPPAFK
jgi:hypothetical protein